MQKSDLKHKNQTLIAIQLYQRCSAVVVGQPIITLQFLGEERATDQFMSQGVLSGEEIEFALNESFRQTYTTAKLLEVLATDSMGVRELHAFTKQPFVECKNARLIQVQTCVDQIVSRCQVILSIAPIHQREVLQVSIVVQLRATGE